MAFSLTAKLNERCACGSGKVYRHCCMRWEMILLTITTMTAILISFIW
jgi:uncharacterized protein YchJ